MMVGQMQRVLTIYCRIGWAVFITTSPPLDNFTTPLAISIIADTILPTPKLGEVCAGNSSRDLVALVVAVFTKLLSCRN